MSSLISAEEARQMLNMSPDSYKETLRSWDETLTGILDHPLGQFLEFYPPVFVAKRLFNTFRPFYLEVKKGQEGTDVNVKEDTHDNQEETLEERVGNSTETTNYGKMKNYFRRKSSKKIILVKNVEEENCSKRNDDKDVSQRQSKKIQKQDTEEEIYSMNIDNDGEDNSLKTSSSMFNWLRGNKTDNKEDYKKDPVTVDNDEFEYSPGYYMEDTNIDEENDSEVEGEYSFYQGHDEDGKDDDIKSVSSLISQFSQKSDKEKEEKELKIKLLSNYVAGSKSQRGVQPTVTQPGPERKDEKPVTPKVSRTRSLKRIFNKEKK